MRNSETERKLLSSTVGQSEALNQDLIDEKGFFNHQKLTKMAKATNGSSFKPFHGNNHVKKEPSLNIKRSN